MPTHRQHLARLLFTFVAVLCSHPLGCTTVPEAHEPATTIIVVRHAEKELNQPDPALTPAGHARAALLADRCEAAAVVAVFSTPYTRTVQTAEPTADRLALEVNTSFKPGAESALGHHIKTTYAGKAVLIVGHSNTVPRILAGLGAPRIPDLPETAYDRLYIVTITPDGAVTLNEQRFGTPTPPEQP